MIERAPVPYRLIDHTADLCIEVEAPDLATLFARAALALHDVIADTAPARADRARPIDVEGHDVGDALVRVLEEALHAFEVEGMLFAAIEEMDVRGPEGGPVRARGTARGDAWDPGRMELRRPVKAVTYHDLAVERVAAGWRARVIVDL